MSADPLFRDTVERLLSGDVVCLASCPDLYHYLQESEARDAVSLFLSRIGRDVALTRDDSAFYAVYLDVEDAGTRAQIRNHFERLTTNWEGLLRWLRLARRISPTGHPLQPMEMLYESQLLEAIENSSGLQVELEAIASKFQLKGQGKEPRHRLSQLLVRLERDGYLKQVGATGAIYQATGRWAVLWEQLEFVYQQEGILDAEREQAAAETPDQGGLFHGAP